MSSKTSSRRGPPPPAAANNNMSNGKPNAWSRPLQQPPKPPPGMGAPLVLRERFLHLTLSMVGQKVVLHKTDGTTVEGIFHTFTPFASTEQKYVLKACQGQGVELGSTVIVDAADVAHVHVKSMRLDTTLNKSNGDATFQTDVQISGSKLDKNRDLVAAGSAWTQSSGNARAGGLAGDRTKQALGGNIGEWDQFKANEELFNVQASYDENLYTTELDHSQIDSRKRMEAARIAKEIEGTSSTNIHVAEERGHKLEGDYDEEDRYSGVLKPSLQPRNVDPKTTSGKPKPDVGKKDAAAKEEESSKPSGLKKMNYAAAAAKADTSKAAGPPGFVKPSVVTPGEESAVMRKDQKKEEANGDVGPAPVTPTSGDDSEAKKEETTDDKATSEAKDGEKSPEKDVDKKKSATKLNPDAKSFSFNPSAKTFTPTFGGGAPPVPAAPPTEAYMQPIDPHSGMPLGASQVPPQYMHPGMAQPGMVPMMNAHFAAMRYPPGPYPGMEHQMPMPVAQQHQPQHMQQQQQPPPPMAPDGQNPSAPGSQQASAPGSVDGGDSPAPPASGDDASASASEGASAAPPPTMQQQPPPPMPPQQPGQPIQQQMPYAGGPPQNYYPGMMPPPPGGRYPHPSQMAPPGGNPYGHPMYGTPMQMPPNMMRGPGGGNYYPPTMHYPPGGYDDQGYRGGRGRGRGPGGRRPGGRHIKGGRGPGRGYSGSNYGGSGRQTPQSVVSDGGDHSSSKASTPPAADETTKASGGE